MDVSPLRHNFAYKPQKVVEGLAFLPMPITACSVMESPNLGKYAAFLDAVPPPSKTSNDRTPVV